MGFGTTVGEVIQKGAGGAPGVIGTELFEDGPFESFDQFPMGIFIFQPGQGQPEQGVQGFQIGIGFSRLFDGLGKIGGGQKAGVGLAQTGMGLFDPRLFEVVQGASARRFPGNLAFMEKIQVTFERATRFGCSPGKGSHDSVAAGQPDSQQAGFPLASKMEQNTLILKWLAQGGTLADPANREDKRDDSGG